MYVYVYIYMYYYISLQIPTVGRRKVVCDLYVGNETFKPFKDIKPTGLYIYIYICNIYIYIDIHTLTCRQYTQCIYEERRFNDCQYQ